MNKFLESLKVEDKKKPTYEDYKKKRYEKEIVKEKWANARRNMEGEER